MRIFTLATQKGGSGKSTLAASLAVTAEQGGFKAALLDLDPQGSVRRWSERRTAETPVVDYCEPHQLEPLLATLPKQGFKVVFLDTAGAHNASVAPALQAASYCLVPVQPSLPDVEAATATAAQLKRLGKPFGLVLTQCFGSALRMNDAATTIMGLGNLAPVQIARRADYVDAMTAGLGVTEYQPKSKAANEVRALWGWLDQQTKEKRR